MMGAVEPTLQSSFRMVVGHRQEQSIIRPATTTQTNVQHKRVMVSPRFLIFVSFSLHSSCWSPSHWPIHLTVTFVVSYRA